MSAEHPGSKFELRRPVVLVGLMGAGKTTVGRRLAAALGARFADSDREIEAAAGMSIAEIFETLGEPEFREGERRVIARLLSGGPKVLATGGGAFMNPATRELIRRKAVSVWLDADLDTLFARVGHKTNRPLLLAGDPRRILAELIERRYPVYAEADLRVPSRVDDPHEAVVARILGAMEAAPAPALAHRAG